MDLLEGKEIMVWTFMGNTRMYQALRDYGDRISQIGLFSFKVNASGEIYESGISIATGSTMRTYINKWPHIKWLLTVSNDGTNSIFAVLRDNTDGAQDTFLIELIRIMEEYDFCDGIDIDLEKGDDYSTATASTAMFKNIYNAVKAYDSTKLVNICLPGMTSVNGSVGGENWCVYGDLNNYCDTAAIMSYGMAWAGSAPSPVSPRFWLEGIYDYAVTVMTPSKVFLGMPAYGWNWQIYDTPENLGKTYWGTSNTYYAAKYWMTGKYNFTDDAPPQPFIPIVAYWDDDNMVPYAFPMCTISWRDRTPQITITPKWVERITAGTISWHTPSSSTPLSEMWLWNAPAMITIPTAALSPSMAAMSRWVKAARSLTPLPLARLELMILRCGSVIPSGIRTASMYRWMANPFTFLRTDCGGLTGGQPSGSCLQRVSRCRQGHTPSWRPWMWRVRSFTVSASARHLRNTPLPEMRLSLLLPASSWM